jgi:3-hydroxymyristoyl/3-hydroxydecanoyl-(acyl carrier protein) dehydratase
MLCPAMPLDPDFVADCPYGPEALFIDEVLDIDAAKNSVTLRMPTTEDLPLTRHQRVHPQRHPRHVNGGLMVHMTGVVGMVHAYYVLGLRHAEGWIGYGGRIYSARFVELARPGEPLILHGQVTKIRRSESQIFARYDLRFTQAGRLVYEGDQGAMWLRVNGDAS